MVYLGRSAARSPVYLWRRDFSKKVEPKELAIADQGISKTAWPPDGSHGAALIGGNVGRVVAIEPGSSARSLVDGADEIAFDGDGQTLYVVKVTRSGANDRAQVLAVTYADGKARTLTDFTYPHPAIVAESALKEAAFADDGGLVRLYSTSDGNLVLWILGAPATYRIDPASGTRAAVTRTPVLWSPDGTRRVEATLSGSTTTLALKDEAGATQASVRVGGLVSHLRWAPNGAEVSFTLSRGSGGAVLQDLYVWDLKNGKAPMALTSNGASHGGEWLGASQSWEP